MKVEQRAALATFRTLVAPLRLRVTADTEGWPIARGRYGQVEWHAPDTVAIYSQTMRMLARLAQIPGVRRHQIGDDEFRLLLTGWRGRGRSARQRRSSVRCATASTPETPDSVGAAESGAPPRTPPIQGQDRPMIVTRPHLAVTLDDAPPCPACELSERHEHRTRRSPATIPRSLLARGLPRRPGAPSLQRGQP